MVVSISGRLASGPSLQEVERELNALVDQGATHLILDLSALRSLDSSGISVILAAAERLTSSGGQLRLAGSQGLVAQTFSVVHLDRIVPLDPDVQSAIQAMQTLG